jgi:hypothetical protein
MSFVLLMMAHQFGDYIFQSAQMVFHKSESSIWVIFHSAVYTLCVLIFALLWGNTNNLTSIMYVVFLSHVATDFIRIESRRKFGANLEFLLFCVDQLIHIVILYFCSKLLSDSSKTIEGISSYLGIEITVRRLFILFSYITITTPAAVFVKHILNSVQSNTSICAESVGTSDNTGTVIGILERILLLSLTIIDQYAVIGFVLAAKSMARFKNFDDKAFAERYLIGTLSSIGIVIVLASIFHFLK